MNRRERLEAHYIARSGICGIFLAGLTSDKPVVIGIDQLTGPPLEELAPRRWSRLWCARADQAEAAISGFRAEAAASRCDRKTDWFDLHLDDAAELLRRSAHAAGIVLTDNRVVVERSSAVVAALDRKREEMNAAGEMRAVNKAYRAYREGQERAGAAAIAYAEFVDERLMRVLDAIADEVSTRV